MRVGPAKTNARRPRMGPGAATSAGACPPSHPFRWLKVAWIHDRIVAGFADLPLMLLKEAPGRGQTGGCALPEGKRSVRPQVDGGDALARAEERVQQPGPDASEIRQWSRRRAIDFAPVGEERSL